MKKKICLEQIRKNNKQWGLGDVGVGVGSGVGIKSRGRWRGGEHCKKHQKTNKWEDVYYNSYGMSCGKKKMGIGKKIYCCGKKKLQKL